MKSTSGEAMRAAIDTNVLLSGLFFNGNERKILQLAISREIFLVIPETVLIETSNNLRKKFSHHLELEKAKGTFEMLVGQAEVVPIHQAKEHFQEAKANLRDETDAPTLAACLFAKPDCLITGDKDFFNLKKPTDFKIMTAGQFLELTLWKK